MSSTGTPACVHLSLLRRVRQPWTQAVDLRVPHSSRGLCTKSQLRRRVFGQVARFLCILFLVCVFEIGIVGNGKTFAGKIKFSRNADWAACSNFIEIFNFSSKGNQTNELRIRKMTFRAIGQISDPIVNFGIEIKRKIFRVPSLQDDFVNYVDFLSTRLWTDFDHLSALLSHMRFDVVRNNSTNLLDYCSSAARIENCADNVPFRSFGTVFVQIQQHLTNDKFRSELKNQTSVHQARLAFNIIQSSDSGPNAPYSHQDQDYSGEICGRKKAAEVAVRLACGCYCLLLGCTLVWRQPEDTSVRSLLRRVSGPTLVGLGLAMFLFPPYYTGDCEDRQDWQRPFFQPSHNVGFQAAFSQNIGEIPSSFV